MPENESIDFGALLETDAADAVRPPLMPTGQYRCMVKGSKRIKSRVKQTPGLEFELVNFEPMSDVDVDQWNEFVSHKLIDVKKLSKQTTFYVTPAALYRLKEFCEFCGVEPVGTLQKLVAETKGQNVLVMIVQTPFDDGSGAFNELQSFAQDV